MYLNKNISVLSRAVILAIIVNVGCYCLNNCPISLWDNVDVLTIEEYLMQSFMPVDEDTNDAFFINVGYDQQLVDYDINGWNTGRVSITDRKTLLDFLTFADSTDEADKYRLIYLDIRFEEGYHTEWDSALFSRIINMPNVYFSHHANTTIVADSLLPKAVRSDYYTNLLNSSFSRYQFVQDGNQSAALCIDSIVNKKTIRQFGPLYFTEGSLCQNSPFIPLKQNFVTSSSDGVSQDCYDLGPFLLENPDLLLRMMQGRIVIVGNYIDDMHGTYRGDLPGPYLIYAAYKYLCDGRHKVNWKLTFLQLLLFTILFFLSIRWKDMSGRFQLENIAESNIARKLRLSGLLRNQFFLLAVSFLTFDVLLMAICIIVYLNAGIIFNTAIPAFVLTLTNYYYNFRMS